MFNTKPIAIWPKIPWKYAFTQPKQNNKELLIMITNSIFKDLGLTVELQISITKLRRYI